MSLISIIIPVFNNARSLADLLGRFQALASKNDQDRFEFVFVDDGSYDESFSLLCSMTQLEPRIRIVKLSRNFGSNAALSAGLSQARGDAIVVIAADLQDPPELIHDLLEQWRQGQKVVLAAREAREDGFLTSLISNTFYAMFRRFAIGTMPKKGFDFFLIDRKICDLINGIQENNVYLTGLILWLGFTPKVLYYHRRKRDKNYGHSMWTFSRKLKYFIDSFVAFTYFPVRAASVIGLLVSGIGVIGALIIISLKLFSPIPVESWMYLMIALFIFSGFQMLMVGILGEYIWRNLDETRKRPRFIIDELIEKKG